MKLWEKSTQVNEKIEKFTVGKDREMDLYLAEYDILGSLAHAAMLESVGLLKRGTGNPDRRTEAIYQQAKAGQFVIEDGVEDVHSQVELMLTRKLGSVGKNSQRAFSK